jgi:citrate lyase subunit beta / citryl-CoA lyase
MLNRSYMFVPGDSKKKLGKAQSVEADALIVCLEDAVIQSNKAQAREMTRDYLLAHKETTSSQLWVRVNPVQTEHLLADLVAIMAGAPFGIFLPKPTGADDIIKVDHYLTVLEQQNSIAIGTTRIITLAESALGALNQPSYVGISSRVRALTWGAEDMATDLGALTNVDENGEYFLVHQLSRANCLTVSAAGQFQAVDSPYLDYRDEAGLRLDCTRARREGFTGKVAIHPSQVSVINECFSPSEDEIAFAKRVIQAFDEGEGAGTVGLDGKMLDMPHLKQAQRLLASIVDRQ